MKVFISWSGESSRRLAKVLHDWLPSVIQNVIPYMSAENIDKGERWSVDIATQLQETNYGIVCVTPGNIDSPWIHFESGALSKSIQNAKVSPIIFGLSPSDFTKSPLLQFQLTQFNKAEISKLLISINNSSPDGEKINQDIIIRSFNRAWVELEQEVHSIEIEKPSIEAESGSKKESSHIDDAIQEILTNTRSQVKTLNSPRDLLPPTYLIEALKEASIIMPPISKQHLAWRDIEEGLTDLNLLSALLLEKKIVFDDSVSDEDIERFRRAVNDIKRGIRYVNRKLYGDTDSFFLQRGVSSERNLRIRRERGELDK